MENRRVYERFDLEVPARIAVVGSGQAGELSLKTSNICAGGAFFVTTDLLPEGTKVTMDLILSIEKLEKMLDSYCRIKVDGEVIRKESRGIAIRFDEDYEIMPVKRAVH